ncbi:MAG: CehA/McbA family metallohydrolase [Bacillota bacterium]
MASKNKVFTQIKEDVLPISGLEGAWDIRIAAENYRFSRSRALGMEGVDTQPDSCLDSQGNLWITWVRTENELDSVMVACVSPSKVSDALKLSVVSGTESSPRIVALRDDRRDRGATGVPEELLYVVWVAKRGPEWLLLGRHVGRAHADDGTFGPVLLGPEDIIDRCEGGIRSPALLSTRGPGLCGESEQVTPPTLIVAWERVSGRRRQIALRARAGANWSGLRLIGPSSGDCYRPALAASEDGGDVYLSYDCSSKGSYNIRLVRLAPELLVNGCGSDATVKSDVVNETDLFSFHSAPLVDSEGRLWLAYASNHRPDRDGDLVKWIHLYCLDKNMNVLASVEPQADREMDSLDEDQTWEFPSLIADAQGRIWMFGRSSHSFHCQHLSGEGWSPRINFALKAWGSRGNRISLNRDRSGRVWIVYRGPRFIEIQKLETFTAPSRPGRSETLNAPGDFQHPQKLRFVRVADFGGHSIRANRSPRFSVRVSLADGSDCELFLFFGDIHAHSYHSDGTGEVDEFLTRCRDLLHMDFAALTDHEYFCQKSLLASSWAEICQMAQAFTHDGEFIAFPGYEWTGRAHPGPGHKHVIYPFDYPPLFSKARPDFDDDHPDELVKRVKEAGGIAIPHHTAWAGVDWENHDPDAEPLFEICSCHGANEFLGSRPIPPRADRYFEGFFIRDLLLRGLKFGLCGGTDNHGLLRHHGVSWTDDTSRSGLTAVYARELTRASLWEAFLLRRTYATSGAFIVLLFMANGYPMGSEVITRGQVLFRIVVRGTDRLESVTLVRDGSDHAVWRPGDECLEVEADETIPPEKTCVYYVRVVQSDGHMAWSSPIWVRREGLPKASGAPEAV